VPAGYAKLAAGDGAGEGGVLTIDEAFWALFPQAMIGTVVVRGLDNRRAADVAATMLEARIAETAEAMQDTVIPELPAVAPWRAAYQTFGVKPSKTKSSIENLLRSAVSGRLRSINPLVDLYNVVSLKHRLPCGGEDIDTIVGPIRLMRAIGDEPFVPLGGIENEPPPAGAVIYRDDAGVICSCWNWREADRTKLTDDTTNAFLCIEALAPTDEGALRAACNELAALVTGHLGGEAETTIHRR
jgi:DNA/RNA-binding domain of Phe-tRNA-synthetase-like protein